MSNRRLGVSSDANVNPDLAEQMSGLRGGMAEAAERVPLPDRFTFKPDPDAPRMIVTDQKTGLTTSVKLCDWHGVRSALNDLF